MEAKHNEGRSLYFYKREEEEREAISWTFKSKKNAVIKLSF